MSKNPPHPAAPATGTDLSLSDTPRPSPSPFDIMHGQVSALQPGAMDTPQCLGRGFEAPVGQSACGAAPASSDGQQRAFDESDIAGKLSMLFHTVTVLQANTSKIMTELKSLSTVTAGLSDEQRRAAVTTADALALASKANTAVSALFPGMSVPAPSSGTQSWQEHREEDALLRTSLRAELRNAALKRGPTVSRTNSDARGFGLVRARPMSFRRVTTTSNSGPSGAAHVVRAAERRRHGSKVCFSIDASHNSGVWSDNGLGEIDAPVANTFQHSPPDKPFASISGVPAGPKSETAVSIADIADSEPSIAPALAPTPTPKRPRADAVDAGECTVSALRETSVGFAALDAGQTFVATALCVLAVCGLFMETSDTDNTYDTSVRTTAIPVTLCCNVFSAVWVLSRFFVFTRTGWDVLDTTATIRHQYVRTWLAYDLFCAVPVEWVFVGWAWPVFFGLLLRNVLRFPRILLLTHPTNPLSPPRNWLRFLFFMGVSAVLVVAAAAAFAHIEGFILSTGVYWALITMSGVGYGDVSPTEDGNSRLVSVLTSVLGVCAIATTTAFATSLLTTSDKLTEQLDHKKQMMHSMLQYYDIPWHIQREVIAMFPAVLDAQNEVEFKTIAESLPAFVARKIQGYARAKILHGVPLFAGLASGGDALFDLAKRLRQAWAAQGELIIEAGELGVEMYFLVRGVAEVLVPSEDLEEDIVVATLRTGQYFGEIALIEDTVRTASVQAVTLCEMLVLSKEDFAQVTDTHPELRRLFEDEVFARRKRNAQALKRTSLLHHEHKHEHERNGQEHRGQEVTPAEVPHGDVTSADSAKVIDEEASRLASFQALPHIHSPDAPAFGNPSVSIALSPTESALTAAPQQPLLGAPEYLSTPRPRLRSSAPPPSSAVSVNALTVGGPDTDSELGRRSTAAPPRADEPDDTEPGSGNISVELRGGLHRFGRHVHAADSAADNPGCVTESDEDVHEPVAAAPAVFEMEVPGAVGLANPLHPGAGD